MHYQGYVELKQKRRLTWLVSWLHGLHWEKRKGSRVQARDYCMSTGSHAAKPRLAGPWEVGVFSEVAQGKRTDLQKAIEVLNDGGLQAVVEQMPDMFVKYGRGLNDLIAFNEGERTDPPEVFIAYGPTGCGKSRLSRADGDYWVDPIGSNSWFDGYRGQPNAIFDDFDGKFGGFKLKDMLRVLDRYVLRVPIKGSFVCWKPARVWLTTNIHPADWWDYEGREEHYRALERRVTRIYHWRRDSADRGDVLLITREGDESGWRKWWNGPGLGARWDEQGQWHAESEDKFNFIDQ